MDLMRVLETLIGSQVELTFYNTNPSLQVDSVHIILSDDTVSFIGNFNDFTYLFENNSNTSFDIIAYNNSCDYSTSYDVYVTGTDNYSGYALSILNSTLVLIHLLYFIYLTI